jgi:hypothetical protein
VVKTCGMLETLKLTVGVPGVEEKQDGSRHVTIHVIACNRGPREEMPQTLPRYLTVSK